MSFDWLNVPGLPSDDGDYAGASEPPPSVSFNFGNVGSEPVEQRSESITTTKHDRVNSTHEASQVSNRTQDHHGESQLVNYAETKEDLQVPLSLSKSQLTREEAKTYLRWYGYISSRKEAKLISLDDIFRFMGNFPLAEMAKERIERIFKTCRNSLNIGQFFAILRLISRALTENVMPMRRMISQAAPVPEPKSILAAGNEEVYEEVEDSQDGPELKVDFDSFASLLLTGQKKKKMRRRITNHHKKQKRVRFTDKLVTFQDHAQPKTDENASEGNGVPDDNEPLDLSLPMDQLLKKLAARRNNSALVSKPPSEQEPESQEEKEVLDDMRESLNHFQQIHNVDSVSVGGLPAQVSTVQKNAVAENHLEPLKPTATGSANYLFRSSQQQTPQVTISEPLQPLKPTATGSANYLFRSSQQSAQAADQKPLQPIKTNGADQAPNFLQPLQPNISSKSSQTGTPAMHHFSGQPLQPTAQQPNTFGNAHQTPNLLPPPRKDFGLSPQPTNQSQQLSPNMTANNYFQALLSNSPSPNASTMHLPQQHSAAPYSNFHTPNLQKPPMNMSYLQASYTGPSNSTYNNQGLYPQREYHSFAPSPTPGFSPYPQHQPNNNQNRDYLGDLRALQEHVDQLQNAYQR